LLQSRHDKEIRPLSDIVGGEVRCATRHCRVAQNTFDSQQPDNRNGWAESAIQRLCNEDDERRMVMLDADDGMLPDMRLS